MTQAADPEGQQRYICIHGHFYQPPRENPWLEAIELQDSAAPFHDWNERITKECYAPNGTSRMLDADGLIVRIVNNYSRISFNFGPTLLSWLQSKKPKVHAAILEADEESKRLFGGHGSALAQAYNHPILPLMNPRDRRTTILWGLRDFEHRFRRPAEGMWLPETAVDLATLEILAELGVRFTVLAPNQARSMRAFGDEEWTSVEGSAIDPSKAYLQKLPSGREINLFFYDGPISRAVAFERLLDRGEHLAGRLMGALSDDRTGPQLVHIATDGESYGHHHRFGDMALAYALSTIEAAEGVRLTNYGEFLENHPPVHEVQIIENTSWSCAHGVERWRSDCGCNSGGNPGWNQAWRAPLREALDWLRDALAPRFEQDAAPLLKDPWRARDEYVAVLLDRSPESVARFLAEHAAKELAPTEKVAARKLLELQRNTLLMYTSCGWFFDELSGIETVQVIQYAARALQLDGGDLEAEFLDRLERAKSNVPEHADGRGIFEKFVRPAMIDIVKVGAHHAVSSVFSDPGERTKIFCYTAERQDHRALGAGRSRLVIGRTSISSALTGEAERLSYAVLHFGDHNLDGAVREDRGADAYASMLNQISESFSSGDISSTFRLMQQHFDASGYSLRSLFRDEQRRILGLVIESAVADVQALCRQVYESHAPLMRFVRELGVPQPRTFEGVAQLTIVGQLRKELAKEAPDADHMQRLLADAEKIGIQFDHYSIGFASEFAGERLAAAFQEAPQDLDRLTQLEAVVRIVRGFKFAVDLWEAQNTCYEVALDVYPWMRETAAKGDAPATEWVAHFTELARLLTVRLGS